MQGSGQPGSAIQVLVDGVVANETTVRANRTWSVSLTLDQPGSYQISVRAVYPNRVVLQSITPPVTAVVAEPTPVPTPTVTIGTVSWWHRLAMSPATVSINSNGTPILYQIQV